MDKSFRENVLNIVRKIPFGKVVSYGQVALLADNPRGARQVGWILHAMGLNTPWWRVINNKGYISIRSNPELAIEQKIKLEQEGIIVDNNFNIDIKKYRWIPTEEIKL